MKYRIEYTIGNGYTCNCCSRWSNETIERHTREKAIETVAGILLYDYGDGYYDTTIGIAESPDDFIKNEFGEFEINFNLAEFEKEAKELSEKIKLQRIEEEKIKKEKEETEKILRREEAEKKEFERLKAKFGGDLKYEKI